MSDCYICAKDSHVERSYARRVRELDSQGALVRVHVVSFAISVCNTCNRRLERTTKTSKESAPAIAL